MPRFDDCLRFVFSAEGGYSDDPSDRGGATNLGITQGTYDAWRRGQGLPLQPVKFCEHDEAEAIYRADYWLSPRFNCLPVPLDLVCFDAGVNCGTGRASRWLQSAVGAAADGVIGPKTLTAVLQKDLAEVIAACLAARRAHYARLCEQDVSQRKFYRGWMTRVARLEAATKES